MIAQTDYPAPPTVFRYLMELTKEFYPESASSIEKYGEFSNQLCMRVHTRGFIMFDHKIRQQFFESAIPFFPLSDTNLLHLLCAYSLHQRPDGDTHCRNCGDLHRTQECSRFALVFTSDPTTPTASRYGRERGRAAPRSRTRSRSASTARSFSRGRSVARAYSENRKPAASVAFAPTSEKNVCNQFKKTGSCSFGASCKYKH